MTDEKNKLVINIDYDEDAEMPKIERPIIGAVEGNNIVLEKATKLMKTFREGLKDYELAEMDEDTMKNFERLKSLIQNFEAEYAEIKALTAEKAAIEAEYAEQIAANEAQIAELEAKKAELEAALEAQEEESVTAAAFDKTKIKKTPMPSGLKNPTDKLTRALFNGLLAMDGGENALKMERKGGKNKVTTLFYVNEDGWNELHTTKPVPYFTRRVFSAVCTLRAAGINPITDGMIFELVYNKEQRDMKTTQRQAINDAMDYLGHVWGMIDDRQEIRLRRKVIATAGPISGALVSFVRRPIRYGKHDSMGYDVLDVPYLYKYSEVKGQISNVDRAYLETGESLTEGRVAIQEYLRMEIERMKRSKTTQSVTWKALLSVIELPETGGTQGQANKRTKTKKVIKNLLKDFQNTGYIAGYDAELNHDSILIFTEAAGK